MKIQDAFEPKIRFPDFIEPWKKRIIAQILTRERTPVDVELNNQYVQIGIRSHGKGIFYKKPVSGEDLGNKRVFWVQPECLILNIVFAWEHAVSRTTEKESGRIASHRFPMYSPKNNLVDIDFIVRLFLRPQGKHLLGLASPGGAGRNRTLGQVEFERLKIKVPKLCEQRKIADFLTAVDTRIEQLSRKKALLEDYKKGVMQQLFSQTIRFKDDDGNEYPDWEDRRLGEVAEVISGQHLSPDDYNADGEGTPYFTGPSDFTNDSNQFTKWTQVSTKVAPKDSVLITVKGSGVGKLMYSDLPEVAMGRQLMAVKSHLCSNSLLYQFLATKSLYFEALASGNMIPGLSRPDLLTTKVPIATLPEQQKIADFLSAIDYKIECVDSRVTETKNFKKGLLQQMFV